MPGACSHSRHSCAPSVIPALSSSFLPSIVIPAPIRHSCAGRNPPTPTTRSHLQFIPPPFQGEVRWGVGGNERAPTALQHPIPPAVIPAPLSNTPIARPSFLASPIIPAPSLRHSCAGRNPAVRRLCSPPQTPSGTPAQRLVAGRGLGGRLVPACAGMTERGRRNDERAGRGRSGRERSAALARYAAPPT